MVKYNDLLGRLDRHEQVKAVGHAVRRKHTPTGPVTMSGEAAQAIRELLEENRTLRAERKKS